MGLIKHMLMLTVPLVLFAACESGGASQGAGASGQTVITDSKIGEYDGYSYELWKDKGNTTMTLTGGGCFTCEWSRINNALFRTGRKFDSTKTYKEYGEITFDYGADFQPKGNSYLCVYGWSLDPLVEYYIVESWGNWRPPAANSSLGTIEVDGSVYDVYKTTRVDQPSVAGTKTFDQYWSVRRQKPADSRTEGRVSVTRHFEEWEKLGLELGKLYETSFTVEGYQSSGRAEVYRNELTIGG